MALLPSHPERLEEGEKGARMMRLAGTALLAAMQLSASRADYVPCDLNTCTCAGVSLAQFEKGGPYHLSDASKPGTQYDLCRLLCVCPPLPCAAAAACGSASGGCSPWC